MIAPPVAVLSERRSVGEERAVRRGGGSATASSADGLARVAVAERGGWGGRCDAAARKRGGGGLVPTVSAEET